jgi:flavin-dependent dehydrogenase
VTLFEREAQPVHKVCGEFISQEAVQNLGELGLDLRALGAVPIHALRLFSGERRAQVALPFTALSLSRQILDEHLLRLAISSGAEVSRGARVRSLQRLGAVNVAELVDGTRFRADAVFLATGKHDLADHRRPLGLQPDLVAFKLHFQLDSVQSKALQGHVELSLFHGGYAGLQSIEAGRANLCLVVRRSRLKTSLSAWPALLAAICAEAPGLAERLEGGVACWDRPLALAAIPYGHVQRASDGLWRLGDQAAVIPSFSGDGIAIALHSAERAAFFYLAGASSQTFQQSLARDLRGQVLLATAISQCLVRPPGQALLGAAASLWPGLMSQVAKHTRLRELRGGALKRA